MSSTLAPSWRSAPSDPNVLHSGVWPVSAARNSQGELVIGGIGAAELVATYGSPLYVMERSELISRARSFQASVAEACATHGVSGSVYYASKSFISGHVVSWLATEGFGFDVATGGELAIALAGGADPARIEFQGNNKSPAELHRAVSAGVGCIVIDAPIEAQRINAIAVELGVRQSVMIRVNTGVHADTHEYLATAREDQKFGLSLPEVTTLAGEIASMPGLSLVGLHSHIGSQIFALEGFLEAATRMVVLYAELFAGKERGTVNLGGGFGIAYTESDRPLAPEAMVAAIVDHVAQKASDLQIAMPHIAFEPGRVISGPAGITLYSAGVIKPVSVTAGDGSVAVRTYVSVDGGMSDNARPALYGAHYSARLANRVSASDPALIRIVGKHCESGDIVVDADYLPGDVAPGDLIAVAATGAYCYSLASNYNVVGRPPVVWVDGGTHGLMIEGESLEDVLGRDRGLSQGKSGK
jgi:diaminopimelate decarboxylase